MQFQCSTLCRTKSLNVEGRTIDELKVRNLCFLPCLSCYLRKQTNYVMAQSVLQISYFFKCGQLIVNLVRAIPINIQVDHTYTSLPEGKCTFLSSQSIGRRIKHKHYICEPQTLPSFLAAWFVLLPHIPVQCGKVLLPVFGL